MSRLTNKHFSINPPRSIKKCRQDFYIAVEDKLRRLEDIEDELGIDLITLFKAVYGGFYYKDKDCGCVFFNDNFDIHMGLGIVPFFSFTLINDDSYYYYFFKDYGKTWALTKEELKK